MNKLTHKLAIITGTGGLGFEVALALAAQSITVILAGRNAAKGNEAIQNIHMQLPEAQVCFEQLDLANLNSIKAFGDRVTQRYKQVDILVNNAGIMAPPKPMRTVDGFELQLGTNYLGHFSLTQQLLPLLIKSGAGRVVNVSSLAYKGATIQSDTFAADAPYKPFKAYAESKLAQLMFALELQRRSDDKQWHLTSCAAHPGFAATNLFNSQKGPFSRNLLNLMSKYVVQPLLGQSAAEGALPIIYAATAAEAKGGELYGPGGLFEMSGPPSLANIDALPRNREMASQLWSLSEQLTGLSFPKD